MSDTKHKSTSAGESSRREDVEKYIRARSRRGSDRIEGGRLPLYAYLSHDPKDAPRGPIDDR